MEDILPRLREAIAARRCVIITYKGETRTLEAYGIHTAKDGSLLLHARKHDTGAVRTYRVDRITQAAVSGLPFSPVNQVRTETGEPVRSGYPF